MSEPKRCKHGVHGTDCFECIDEPGQPNPEARPKGWHLPLNTLIINSDKNRPNGIHVIEHSAYLKVCAERDELRDELKFIQTLRGQNEVIDSIKSEVERLRAALGKILKCTHGLHDEDEIARKALGEPTLFDGDGIVKCAGNPSDSECATTRKDK